MVDEVKKLAVRGIFHEDKEHLVWLVPIERVVFTFSDSFDLVNVVVIQ